MNNPLEIAIRKFIYERLIESGSPPNYTEIARHSDMTVSEAKRLTLGIKIGKTLLAHPTTGEIWMAGPFSAAKSQYRVIGEKTSWWANCAWDMFGVATIVGEKVAIETSCTDCGEPWTMSAEPDLPPTDDGIVHFLLPAREWYEDIGFT